MTLLIPFVFERGVARLFVQSKAAQMKGHKVQVVLMNDDEPVLLEPGIYHISHTKRWIYFYNENQPDGHIAYPLNTTSSI